MSTRIRCLLLSFLIQAPILLPADRDTYRNPTVGISITKPASWFFEMTATADDARASSEVPVKLVAITKYKEPYPDLNASIRISCVSRDKIAVTVPKTLARILVDKIESHVDNFVVQQAACDVVVAGLKGAYARAFFDVNLPDGSRVAASEEVWVLVAGSLYCVITGESRQDEKTGSRKELSLILETLKTGAAEPALP